MFVQHSPKTPVNVRRSDLLPARWAPRGPPLLVRDEDRLRILLGPKTCGGVSFLQEIILMQPHSARHFYFILDPIPERAEVGDQFQPLTFAMQINLDKWIPIKYVIVISTLYHCCII